MDANLRDHELDGIIEEIDEDGSGTVDFDGERTKNKRVIGDGFHHLHLVFGNAMTRVQCNGISI